MIFIKIIKSRINIDIRMIFYILLLLPYVEPQIFKVDDWQKFDKIYLLWKTGSFLLISFLYIFGINKRKNKKVVFLMTLVQAAIFCSTILNKGSLTTFLGPAINSVSTLMISDIAMSYNFKKYLKEVELLLTIYLGLHLVTFIPKMLGVYPFSTLYYSFIGIENRWIYVLLPLVIISAVNSYVDFNKLTKKPIFMFIISIISVTYVWSVGAMLSFAIFILLLIIIKNYPNKFMKFICGMFLLINYLLVSESILKPFSKIIYDYLGKDLILSGRVYLWREVIQTLQEKPIFGSGVQSPDFVINNFFIKSNHFIGCKVNHPHNHLLYVAYNGGLISLAFFLILIFYICFQIDNLDNEKIRKLLITSAVSIFFAALVDTMDYSLFYLIALIPCYITSQQQKRIRVANINFNV